MQVDLNRLLLSASFILDFIEMDILNDITNHGKRVAYIAVKIGENYCLTSKEKYDLMVFALLHDIGAVENLESLSKRELEKSIGHCIIGEEIVQQFPFHKGYENIILYHHENYNGQGFFDIPNDKIPLFSKIISIADYFELNYEPSNKQSLVESLMSEVGTKFSQDIVDTLLLLMKTEGFWYDISNQFILSSLQNLKLAKYKKYTLQEVKRVTGMFSKIIDSKSKFTRFHTTGLTIRVEKMCNHYDFEETHLAKMLIASDLHDIGKLAISNKILDKKGKLTKDEFSQIKAHAYYTRKVLEPLNGFEEITEWASNHHERNDGSGYPFGLSKNELDFESQLIATLDIYQALREDRPYRSKMTHTEAMYLLKQMVCDNKLNSKIVNDIDLLFEND